jgi:putative ABC transport system permease protein
MAGMKHRPPGWADRFLGWYCNPDLLEEIQGDAYELYVERIGREGKRMADIKYWWDILRFLRASNVRRAANDYRPGFFTTFWNLDFRIALRNAYKHKFTFAVKTIGLSLCLAFTLTLAAFVLHEFMFDRFHPDYRNKYRIGCKVELDGAVTRYAVSPLPMGPTLAAELPDVVGYTRLLHVNKPLFRKGDEAFSHTVTILADSNFLKFFGYRILKGSETALNERDRVVLTQSTARLFFGDAEPLGQMLDFYGMTLEVSAIIEDPSQSHLQFDAILSWRTARHRDEWSNINAYTYIQLHPGASMEKMAPVIGDLSREYLHDMIAEYNAKFEPIIQNVAGIHLSGYLDEDIAVKRKASNIYILAIVVFFFMLIGLVNYHNIVLAELSAQLRRFGILRVFGGLNAVPSKAVITDAILTIAMVIPITALLVLACSGIASSWFSVNIDVAVFRTPVFVVLIIGFLVVMLVSTRINAWVIGDTDITRSASTSQAISASGSLPLRKYFLAAQLCFSITMLGLILVVIDQFRFINTYDKGIEHSNTIVLTLPDDRFSRAKVLIEELKKIGGVRDAEASSFFPAGQIETRGGFEFESAEGMKQRLVQYLHCDPGYFEMMKVKIISGNVFDSERVGGVRKFLINQTAAKEFGWEDPIGKRLNSKDDDVEGVVVGVVRDFHLGTLHEPVEPLIMFAANEDWGVPFVYIKTEVVHSQDLVRQVEQAHSRVYPDEPFELNFLDSRYANLYQEDHQVQKVLMVGLVISIAVTCLGIFGVSALMMILRTREMGIRKVVGASRLELFGLHMKIFLRVVLVAIAVGAPMVYYLSAYWLNTFAYHITADVVHLLVPGLILVLIVLVTAGWHANRNSMVNPVDVLKQEN